VKLVLGVDLPDGHVDASSTSSPLEMLWEIYSTCRANGTEADRYMAYAARTALKTLTASIFEVLCLVHLDRDVVHLAAIVDQSQKAQDYFNAFFNRPMLRDFRTSKTTTYLEITRYVHVVTGEVLSPPAWKALQTDVERQDYDVHVGYIDITACTMQGTNCWADGSTVRTKDRGLVAIEEVRVGESVLGCDLHTGEDEWMPVGGLTSTSEKCALGLTFEDGARLFPSEDHPMFTDVGWLRARGMKSYFKVACRPAEERAPRHMLPPVEIQTEPEVVNPASVLLGTCLGDASLSWPRGRTGKPYGQGPRLHLRHSEDQEHLLRAVERAVRAFGLRCSTGVLNRDSSGYETDQEHLWLSSSVSERLVDLYRLLYPNGVKTITKELLELLDAEALAYWIMDDGCASHLNPVVAKDHPVTLATCCFSPGEHELMVEFFRSKWGLAAKRVVQGRHSLLVFDMRSSRAIADLVAPFMLPSMKYKLPVPQSMADSECLSCGRTTSTCASGFPRCGHCGTGEVKSQRYHGKLVKKLRGMCTATVVGMEFYGKARLWDLHIDTDKPHHRNFWVYCGARRFLAHNSKHAAVLVVDEVDVIEGEKVRAYEQAKAIPDAQRGKNPFVLYISTRKTNFGKVQAEIDAAETTGLVVRHWNIIDVTEPCPASRHEPGKPHVVLYRSEKTLRVLTEPDYAALDENRRKDFEPREAFWGCQHNCKLFGPCEGRLAIVRTDRKATTMKRLGNVTSMLRAMSTEMVIAELLCRKPGTEGLIYPSLDPDVHLLTAARMAEVILGEHVAEPFYQEQLVELMLARDFRPVAGIDFGYSHNFSLVLGFTDGNRLFVVDAYSQPELMPDKQVAAALRYLQPLQKEGLNPRFSARIYPDTANPQMIKVLIEAGLHCVRWQKTPGSVLAGIEAMRVSLGTLVGQPQLLFLRGNERVEFFFQRLSQYNWKREADGRPSDVPNDVNDDECDATRYMVQNVLGKYSHLVVAPDAGVDVDPHGAAVNIHRQLVGMPGRPSPSGLAAVSPEVAAQLHWNQIAGQVGLPQVNPGETRAAVKGSLGDTSHGRRGTFSYDI
jgi:hypothetical protein